MQATGTVPRGTKEQVADNVPKRIKQLDFGVLSKTEIVNQAVLEVCDRALFDLERNRAYRTNGPLDGRMGVASKSSALCETCGQKLEDCVGHFGYVPLVLPAFHIGYLRTIITILQAICKHCSKVLLLEKERRQYLRSLRRPNLDSLQRSQICKRVIEQCKKAKICQACGEINGTVKKGGKNGLKIFHDKFRAFNASTSVKKVAPQSKVHFDASFEEARIVNPELDKHVKKAMDDLNPVRVLKLFQRIGSSDCELLGMDPQQGRPDMFLWQAVPAPPVCIRPSVAQDMASTEDDITTKLSDIIHCNQVIAAGLNKGVSIPNLMEQWDHLQLQVALYINSDMPGLDSTLAKTMRGFCQRLKGKQGRFRGNLSGKRVDFSGRTVISPDPNLAIDQVAVPVLVAKNLTYPEKVNTSNLDRLRETVSRGPSTWPGANAVSKKSSGLKLMLKYGNLENHAKRLQVGDVVERHLIDGDIVLFNRQPSLHKLSILSHFVKVRPHRTFRLNECVCNPYNADFDGDEMNLHVPQTEEARAEARELMGVRYNLATPKNGEPIISAIQDFITAAYLLSSKDQFYSRKDFANICMFMMHAEEQIDLPPPAIVKPQAMWTGKQIFNVMMRPRKSSPVLVNLDAQCREYRKPDLERGDHPSPDMNKDDAYLCIRNSEIMCGVMDKSTVGSGKKGSVFYIILRDYGPEEAVAAMGRLAKLCARWLALQGFSIGINDVTPHEMLNAEKEQLVKSAYDQCDSLIKKFASGKLTLKPGMDGEGTLEADISAILTGVRNAAGDRCVAELSKRNAPLVMAKSGSKGSNINVSQMTALVGQQIIGQKRIQQGFQDRTLPHFPKHDRHPPSKGFVRNSFYSGLTPFEFIFHAMSGREGLVDTAVKTAETGYMSRRLMKSLEDLSSQYDDTVRNSASNVIQFQYGDDKLDPVNMEGKAQPVNFERTFTHSQSLEWNEDSEALPPWEIMEHTKKVLASRRNKLSRRAFDGSIIAYQDKVNADDPEEFPVTTDMLEAERDFLNSVEVFLQKKVNSQVALRKRLGLTAATSKKESVQRKTNDRANKANLAVDSISKLSREVLDRFIASCLEKHHRAKVEPGHAVGAVGAQSIGEPGTQMTLKTFHFAGVAGMSITGGVPRIKEIINASKLISTPVIDVVLENKQDPVLARRVKGRIEKTYLTDILSSCQLQWYTQSCDIVLTLDFDTIRKLGLDEDISMDRIKETIVSHKKLKIGREYVLLWDDTVTVRVQPPNPEDKAAIKAAKGILQHLSERVEQVFRILPSIAVTGHPEATRAIIIDDSKKESEKVLSIAVEGYGLQACMNTPGADGTKTKTNSIMEMREVLGIEAARSTIVSEITKVMQDMDIDPRHMQLLADVMTAKGEVLGITRFGLAKMRDSVLQLASFEKTPDHLFEAACKMKSDMIEGVSECIIMGQTMSVGTGAFKVVRPMGWEDSQLGRKKTEFEDAFQELYAKPKRAVRT